MYVAPVHVAMVGLLAHEQEDNLTHGPACTTTRCVGTFTSDKQQPTTTSGEALTSLRALEGYEREGL